MQFEPPPFLTSKTPRNLLCNLRRDVDKWTTVNYVPNLFEKCKNIISGQLTVITIGSLSNVALAVSLDPNFIGRLKHLYVGAGHIHSKYNCTLLYITLM